MNDINKTREKIFKIKKLIAELSNILNIQDETKNDEILQKKHKIFEELIIAYIQQMNEESLDKVKNLADIYANTELIDIKA
jgi:hypothetical protein